MHRGNGLWYNKKLLTDNGVEVGATMSVDEFLAAADKLKAAGVTPLCVGDSGIWATAQLFENTLLGVIGPEKYKGLWDGSTSFGDPDVKQAMETYGKMLDYQNEDHSALSWDQAVKKLMEGGCAFSSMGDWAYGEFVNAKQKDNEDFGWVSHPGTAGSFMIVADGFVLGNGAPDVENTTNWLKVIGSKEAQEAFNPLKGSICARTDCDRAKFGAYHNWSMDSFAKDALVPSVVHGSAAPADFQQALNDAVTSFVVDRNVDAFSSALVAAAQVLRFRQVGTRRGVGLSPHLHGNSSCAAVTDQPRTLTPRGKSCRLPRPPPLRPSAPPLPRAAAGTCRKRRKPSCSCCHRSSCWLSSSTSSSAPLFGCRSPTGAR